MSSNVFISMLAELSNFTAAGGAFTVGPFCETDDFSHIRAFQSTLPERWWRHKPELEDSHDGWPLTLAPAARVSPAPQKLRDQFTETRNGLPGIASIMQNYQIAQMLLLINKPHESSARPTTFTGQSRILANTTRHHSREKCGTFLCRLADSVQVHPLEPLVLVAH